MSYDPLSLKKAPAMVLPVSAELKIALTLYYLSDAGRMRKSANAFVIVKSTVSKIVYQVSIVIRPHLGSNLLRHPSSEKVKVMAYFILKSHGYPTMYWSSRWNTCIHQKSQRRRTRFH